MKARESLRAKLYRIIFEADTAAGKYFDVALIICIKLSVLAVMLDSVRDIHSRFGAALTLVEWFFTILFSLEYGLRIYSAPNPKQYIVSFFGIVDLLAILPTYCSILLPGSQYLLVIRVLRVLRIFRVLKLVKFIDESNLLMRALWASRRKVFVFFYTVISLVVILGSLMYVIESEQSGFTSIPMSIYWAVVTLTTVGYGDISPVTGLGQTLAAVIMLLGYSIIAVPTGIVTVEIARAVGSGGGDRSCPGCLQGGHDDQARYCKHCGERLAVREVIRD